MTDPSPRAERRSRERGDAPDGPLLARGLALVVLGGALGPAVRASAPAFVDVARRGGSVDLASLVGASAPVALALAAAGATMLGVSAVAARGVLGREADGGHGARPLLHALAGLAGGVAAATACVDAASSLPAASDGPAKAGLVALVAGTRALMAGGAALAIVGVVDLAAAHASWRARLSRTRGDDEPDRPAPTRLP